MTKHAQLSLDKITLETANPNTKSILDNIQKTMGFIPNMYATMANTPMLLKTYLSGYELLRTESLFTSIEQEVLFLSISRFNGCEYCVAAHSVLADNMSGVPTDITNAIRDGQPINDPKLAELYRFTIDMLESRGRPSSEAMTRFIAAGYSEQHVLEIIVAIAIKTLSNYSNHLFNPEVDKMFAKRLWSANK